MAFKSASRTHVSLNSREWDLAAEAMRAAILKELDRHFELYGERACIFDALDDIKLLPLPQQTGDF